MTEFRQHWVWEGQCRAAASSPIVATTILCANGYRGRPVENRDPRGRCDANWMGRSVRVATGTGMFGGERTWEDQRKKGLMMIPKYIGRRR